MTKPVRLMTLEPGHFHAALVQKTRYPEVDDQVHVYARVGPDLNAHLQRIANFNSRADNPTAWQVVVHSSDDPLGQMLRDRPGNVVVLSGRNRGKIDLILASLEAGLHVLADKPWIIDARDFPRLQRALAAAEKNGLVALDIMTERHEITSILQRELVAEPAIFGEPLPGTPDEPCVFMESVHYLLKSVAGVPNRRPAWFFDIQQQGEGLTDVGTHLVDLVNWVLFPGQGLDHTKDVQILAARRWPTVLTRFDFQRVTGEPDFPDFLADAVKDAHLHYFCNTLASYCVRGLHVKLNVLWDFEALDGGGDTHFAVIRGQRSRVEVRQGREQNSRPELYVVPAGPGEAKGVGEALRCKLAGLQHRYPGVAVVDRRGEFYITIPERYRVGHEAHFAEVMQQFLGYLRDPSSIPAWEQPNLLTKYHITTASIARARAGNALKSSSGA